MTQSLKFISFVLVFALLFTDTSSLLRISTIVRRSIFSNSFSPISSMIDVSSIRTPMLLYSMVAETPTIDEIEEKVIIITSKAMIHIKELRTKMNDGKTCLRMGVKSGGCSGMSYVMDFITEDEIIEDDHIEMCDEIKCAVDPKSLLYLYGLQLDYSDELIGGGFKFSNPNAESACGCGKSFGV